MLVGGRGRLGKAAGQVRRPNANRPTPRRFVDKRSRPLSHKSYMVRMLTFNRSAACLTVSMATPPPPGYPRWTTRTLAVELTGLQGMPTVSRELVRRTLKRHGANGSGSPGAALTAELTPAAGTDKADPGG